MHYITTTEFENDLDYYIELSNKEDIYVTRDNEVIVVLTSPDKHRLAVVDKIAGSFGKVDSDIDYDEIIKEEIFKRNIH